MCIYRTTLVVLSLETTQCPITDPAQPGFYCIQPKRPGLREPGRKRPRKGAFSYERTLCKQES